ncbi:MAG: GTPase ObgE [Peptococcaceae bacterium]|nr:GTPase ObgE [Peptococcaceae bacterium]
MFYDKAKIYIKGGDGGNGCIAMRREKYVPEGGPWGGDGGRGGNVILRADEGLRTLVDFRYRRHYKSERGRHGEGKNRHGSSGDSLVIRVPVGTVVRDADKGKIIADLTTNGQEVVVARGGRGGRGNAHFSTAQNKAPKMAEKGEPGEELWLELELKLLADVGLVGFPNVGKSTLLSKVSAAKPKIASYPFTTITPNLGMVRLDDGYSFVVADIPGLIEGAHTGVGLGHDFLRHVERTRLLVHIIEAVNSEERDPVEDFQVTNNELLMYNPAIAKKPQVIAVNKIDLPGGAESFARIQEAYGQQYEIFPISAITGEGLNPLIYKVAAMLEEIPAEEYVLPDYQEENVEVHHVALPRFTVNRVGDGFTIEGDEIRRHVAMTDLYNDEALERLQRIMRLMGIDSALAAAGAKEGDTIKIGEFEFEYVE